MFGAGINVGASGIGPQGAIGSQGTSSAAGAQGNQGFQGRQGSTGSTGSQGAQGAQGSGNWSPLDLPNLVAWYDASDIATITKDGSNYISSWLDLGPNAYHLAGDTIPNPLWVSAGQNGLDCIDFNGSMRFKIAAGNGFATSPTARCVLATIRPDGGGSTATLVGNLTASDGYEFRITDLGGNPGFDVLESWVAHHVFGSTFTTAWHSITAQIVTAGTLGYGTGLAEGYVDGSISGSSTTFNVTFSSADVVQWIGHLFDGRVGEIVIVDGLVSAGDRSSWFTYSKAKWGTP